MNDSMHFYHRLGALVLPLESISCDNEGRPRKEQGREGEKENREEWGVNP